MTVRKLLLTPLVALLLMTAAAEARPRPGGHLGGRAFEANKTFGLGLELGAPTGLTGKWFFAGDRAIDFGIGDIYNYFNRSGLHIYGDFLFHPTSLASTESFELPLYIGVGGRIWDFRDSGPDAPNDAFAFGVRVPIGVSLDFNALPLDLFLQFVPVLDFFSGYRAHSVYLDLDFSIGARYWFN
jgi:hypothetical protein